MEHAFGRRPPFTLGMEEELLVVDAADRSLRHGASDVLARVDPPAGRAIHDTYEALVELTSPICTSAPQAAASLDALRACVRDAGAEVIGAGLHPTAAIGDVVHVAAERYRRIADTMRGLLRRTPTAALHVHVGMPDPETAVAACNRMRAHLPLLAALSAHSPYWHGVDSGFDSARAQVWRGFPRATVPREFRDWEQFVAVAEAAVRAGDLPDYTFLWWDVRPHPRLGTVELRAMDAQSRLAAACGLAALVHALAVRCVHEPPAGELPPTEALVESSFRAARDGLRASIWWRGALRPVPEVAREVLADALPYARDTGGDEALGEVERILREGNGADRMRAAHARGGMQEVLELLVEETRAPLGAYA